ncbi:MAG: hypothetical protein ACXWFF_12295 [Methylomonas sp.]
MVDNQPEPIRLADLLTPAGALWLNLIRDHKIDSIILDRQYKFAECAEIQFVEQLAAKLVMKNQPISPY